MQLKKHQSVKFAITALTAALISNTAASASDQDQIESSLLIYSEKSRVSAAEGIVGISKHIRNDYLLGLRLTYDGLTGPSPNGATPSSRIQTFTRPSGSGTYDTQVGETPLDDTFKDTRFAVDASIGRPVGRMTQVSTGFHFSTEHDYSSLGFSGGLTHDLFQRNTTIGLSGSYSRDAIKPEGGAPLGFSSMQPPSGEEGEGDDEHDDGVQHAKDVFDAVLSVNQVIDRKTIFRMNYSFSHSSGYLSDPYKILSVVQDANSTAPGAPDHYIYEKRPTGRNKHAVFGEVRRYLGGHAIDIAYRYFWDNWGVRSHTADMFFTLQLKNGQSVQPHVRWYSQSEADFHRYFLVEGAPLPENASADSRLARFSAVTLGLEYSLSFNEVSRLRLTGEYYTQMSDNSPPEAFGELRQYDLFPKLDAFMLRLGFVREF